jgi:hypothetical protein
MAKKTIKRKTVTPEGYVAAYKRVSDRGGSIDDVARALGMTKANAVARQTGYKKAGVKLPKLARKKIRRINVEKLNSILSGK